MNVQTEYFLSRARKAIDEVFEVAQKKGYKNPFMGKDLTRDDLVSMGIANIVRHGFATYRSLHDSALQIRLSGFYGQLPRSMQDVVVNAITLEDMPIAKPYAEEQLALLLKD